MPPKAKITTGILVLVFALVLFLVSCQPPALDEPDLEAEAIVTTTGCTSHSECIDENYMRLQAENCTWSRPEKCERGCADGECRPAEICTTGFKCIDDSRRGYQKEDCSFIRKKECEWGCEEGRCREKSANASADVTAPAEPAAPAYSAIAENQEEGEAEEKTAIYTLKVGEQEQIEINGVSVNVSIHFLEPAQVTLKVNGIKSNPLPEQGNATYENIGATFQIEWIIFQGYAGGKQEIGYRVK